MYLSRYGHNFNSKINAKNGILHGASSLDPEKKDLLRQIISEVLSKRSTDLAKGLENVRKEIERQKHAPF